MQRPGIGSDARAPDAVPGISTISSRAISETLYSESVGPPPSGVRVAASVNQLQSAVEAFVSKPVVHKRRQLLSGNCAQGVGTRRFSRATDRPTYDGTCRTVRPLSSGLEVPILVFGVDGLADHIRRTRTREEVVVLLTSLVKVRERRSPA